MQQLQPIRLPGPEDEDGLGERIFGQQLTLHRSGQAVMALEERGIDAVGSGQMTSDRLSRHHDLPNVRRENLGLGCRTKTSFETWPAGVAASG